VEQSAAGGRHPESSSARTHPRAHESLRFLHKQFTSATCSEPSDSIDKLGVTGSSPVLPTS
jgi:hypothetical protein